MSNINYVDYIAENLDRTIQYSEYLAENIDKNINYTEYIAENLDSPIRQDPNRKRKEDRKVLRKKIHKVWNTKE